MILFYYFTFEFVLTNLYQLFLFTRFDDTSSDKEFESAAVAKGVGWLSHLKSGDGAFQYT